MLRMEIKSCAQDEWRRIIAPFEDLSLMQTWEYGQTKAWLGSWRVRHHIFKDGDHIVGVAQALVRELPFGLSSLVWLNRGPLWRKSGQKTNTEILFLMLKQLKDYWVEKKNAYFRLAPMLFENDDEVSFMKKTGFVLSQPANAWASIKIDLTLTEEELRHRMRPNWRGHLNRALRKGLAFRCGTDESLIGELMTDYMALLKKKEFQAPLPFAFIPALQQLLPDEDKMWVFICYKEDRKVGSILMTVYDNTCEYLIGAITDQGRQVGAGQFLLWQALREMKRKGYQWLDLSGADPKKTLPGIFSFKQGVGGDPYRLIGEWEAYRPNFWNRLVKLAVCYGRRF